MCNAVPVFEVKNKLSFFIHKAENEGPIPISCHGKEVAYIISKEDFDYTEYFDSLRLRDYYGNLEGEHIFDEV